MVVLVPQLADLVDISSQCFYIILYHVFTFGKPRIIVTSIDSNVLPVSVFIMEVFVSDSAAVAFESTPLRIVTLSLWATH